MNRISKFVLFSLCLISSSVFCTPEEGGEILGSGTMIPVETQIAGFTKVEAGFGITQLRIKRGDDYHVGVNIDRNFKPYLHISSRGNTLKLYLEENRMAMYAGEFQAEIISPVLGEIVLHSVTDAEITGFEGASDFKASLYSSSKLWGDIEVNTLDLHVFSNSEVTLTGSADQVNIRTSDSGMVDLAEFPVRTASVNANTESVVKLNVLEQLNIELADHSKAVYLGSPAISAVIDDTSHVEPID